MLNLLACLAKALWRVMDSHHAMLRVWTRRYFLKPLLICARDICGEAEQTLICCYLSGSQPSRGECGCVFTGLTPGNRAGLCSFLVDTSRQRSESPQGSDFKKAHTEVCMPGCHGDMECLDWFYDS